MSWNPMQRPTQPSPGAPSTAASGWRSPDAPSSPAGWPPPGGSVPAYPPAGYPPAYLYPAPPPYPYGYPPPGYGAPAAPTNGLAIASLVLGILGIPTFSFFVVPILALILGAVSNAQIRRAGGRQSGRGMAIAGMILGGVAVLFAIGFWILIAGLAQRNGGGTLT